MASGCGSHLLVINFLCSAQPTSDAHEPGKLRAACTPPTISPCLVGSAERERTRCCTTCLASFYSLHRFRPGMSKSTLLRRPLSSHVFVPHGSTQAGHRPIEDGSFHEP